jgi:hypothetical protein
VHADPELAMRKGRSEARAAAGSRRRTDEGAEEEAMDWAAATGGEGGLAPAAADAGASTSAAAAETVAAAVAAPAAPEPAAPDAAALPPPPPPPAPAPRHLVRANALCSRMVAATEGWLLAQLEEVHARLSRALVARAADADRGAAFAAAEALVKEVEALNPPSPC